MNIKIDEKHHNLLQKLSVNRIVMGSQLYGTNNEKSDTDILCIYKKPSHWNFIEELPNFHQFQFTENNIDYIYCTEGQFWKNQRSGDSTINSDIILFSGQMVVEGSELNYCRTQKVIKAYIGFANRDIKQYSKTKSEKKLFHALRGLYTAECLLNNEMPNKQKIIDLRGDIKDVKFLQNWQSELRNRCNSAYENKEIENYFIENTPDELFNLLLQSNNIREFRYE